MLSRFAQWLISNSELAAFALLTGVVVAGSDEIGPGADPLLILIWVFLAIALFFGSRDSQSTADR